MDEHILELEINRIESEIAKLSRPRMVTDPARRGTYRHLSYMFRPEDVSKFVSEEQKTEVQQELHDQKQLLQLTDELVEKNIELYRIKKAFVS
tara:strand:- start:551 stop:829 length:279 start_codon:yes stop_codon:yes gene_type:complete